MEIRILGRDLEVSEIGFGCMGMSHAYGTVSTQKEAEELENVWEMLLRMEQS